MKNSKITTEIISRTTNITAEFLALQGIRSEIEDANEVLRQTKLVELRNSYEKGVRSSALMISFADIARNPSVLDNVTPFSREPGSNGEIVLWQGYTTKSEGIFSTNCKARGPLHQVIQLRDGKRLYMKFNSIENAWTICRKRDEDGNIIENVFAVPKTFRTKSELWKEANANVVARTVMSDAGKCERREFISA